MMIMCHEYNNLDEPKCKLTECQIIIVEGINYRVEKVLLMTLRYAASASLRKISINIDVDAGISNYPRDM